MNFTIVGMGYVGLSLSILLSRKHKVVAFDTDKAKIDLINLRKSPVKDTDAESLFLEKDLNIRGTVNSAKAYEKAKFIIVAVSTNYDEKLNKFDTSKVKKVISEAIKLNPKAFIVIKSTVPIGFTDKMRKKYNTKKIFFSPEFLREGTALRDNLYPSRIIIGDDSKGAKDFAKALLECSYLNNDFKKIHFMGSKESEAVKLFSNTYLAMRIAYFNELDTFSELNNISSKQIIAGVSDDERIGDYYNNPSFGYGGYCLPKDTKQLLNDYKAIPNNLIKSIISSNKTRKKFIVKSIINKKPKVVGIYRLTMKNESDNFRESAVISIIKDLRKHGTEIIIYEPLIKENIFFKCKIINNIKNFKKLSDIVVANRLHKDILSIRKKVYTRDLYSRD